MELLITGTDGFMGQVLKEHGLEGQFDIVISSLDVEHPKPAPDALCKILDGLHVSPQEAVYIGDSEIDEVTAKAAKVPFVAYKNRSLSADHYVEHFQEIEDLIKKAKEVKR